MAIDSGILAADPNNCLSADTPKGTQAFYESPDLVMATVAGDTIGVYPGAVNKTNVTVTWTTPSQCKSPFTKVNYELYVGDPTLPMIPGITLSTLVDDQQIPTIAANGSPVTTTFGLWDSGLIPHLSQPHHACLLARAYPAGAARESGDLTNFPPEDPHYSQHNLYVNTTDGQGLIQAPITNGIQGREAVMVSIQAVPDLNPPRSTLDLILPTLKLNPCFKRISTVPLNNLEFDTSAFKSHYDNIFEEIGRWVKHEILDLIGDQEDKCKKAGGHSTRIVLPPNLFAKFILKPDLSKAKPGDAFVYRITQTTGKGGNYGALLAVFVNCPAVI